MIVLAGGVVCDGSGRPPAEADVYVRDGRIDDVRPANDDHRGWDVVDVRGSVVAPGFIDVHSHGDNAPFARDNAWKLQQGITTEVVGNCGISIGPNGASDSDAFHVELTQLFAGLPRVGPGFGDVLDAADRRGYATNYAPLVGHGNLRRCAMGAAGRHATRQEVARMRDLLREALAAGALGMSTGLIYPPGVFADLDELVALASALDAEHLFTSHMRNESDDVEASVEEIVTIGARSGRRVHVSHHKVAGSANWGRSARTLQTIAAARARGVQITLDAYPYTAGSTSLSATLPPRYHDGGGDDTLRRLAAPGAVADIRATIERGEPGWENLAASAGWCNILIASTADHRFEGETIAGIAAARGSDPVEALVHVLLEERLDVWMIVFMMAEADIERIIADPYTSIGTDGAPPGTGGKPHPRTFGTFPRVLGRYVRERAIVTLEEAVRRMTSLAADTFGIAGRGRIAPGAAADIAVFDAATIDGDDDYRDPVHPPRGLRRIYVNGELAVLDGAVSDARSGRRLLPGSNGR